jgi:hypothetical protein
VPVSAPSPLTVTPRRLLTLTLVLAAMVVGVGTTAAPAAAATKPCWKLLINDWYDGRIDQTYPAKCYRAAIKNLPEDVDAYSTAREDIERALLAAARRKGGPLDPDDPIPPGPGNAAGPNYEDENGNEQAAPPLPGGDDGDNGGLLEAFRPSSADEIPVPLLVLGGLAVLLLGAAAASFVARKIQARRGLEGGPPVS